MEVETKNSKMRPVFIGGCGRSGTTLLGGMLGGNPQVICTPESQFKARMLRGRRPHEVIGNDRRDVFSLNNDGRFKTWNLNNDVYAKIFSSESYVELIEQAVIAYAQKTGKEGAAIWVDHTPSNLAYANTLLNHYPEAKFIHIVRDGRGVAASVMPLDWGPQNPVNAASYWVKSVAEGIVAEQWLGKHKSMRVMFEDLVRNPKEVLQHICTFAEIEFENSMLSGDGFDVPIYTQHQHRLVSGPPDSTRADAWMHTLDRRTIEVFEFCARDMLNFMGYKSYASARPQPPSLKERLRYAIKEIDGRLGIQRLRYLYRSRLAGK